jgi:hypothetical protein
LLLLLLLLLLLHRYNPCQDSRPKEQPVSRDDKSHKQAL